MNTFRPMGASSLRKFACTAAAVAVVCFCSCERHHADELMETGEHVKSGAAEKEAPHDKAERLKKETMGDQQQMSTTALTPTPSPSAAQFFPSATPH